jgi:peroxiredoxin Q/BCP
MHLAVGDRVPSFQGYDHEGNVILAEDLLGCVTVLYFYPKDFTSGCTKEACDFRDAMNELQARGVVVIGISPDTADSHQKFMEEHRLAYQLLCDPTLEVAQAFGVCRPQEHEGIKIERSTFIIDEKGIIRWIEKPVNVENHIHRILKALDAIRAS